MDTNAEQWFPLENRIGWEGDLLLLYLNNKNIFRIAGICFVKTSFVLTGRAPEEGSVNWKLWVAEGNQQWHEPWAHLGEKTVGTVDPPTTQGKKAFPEEPGTSPATRLYAGGELRGSPVGQALSGHKRRIPLAVVLPRPGRGAGTDRKSVV